MPSTPTPPVRLVLSKLQQVKAASGGWVALCPAHDDTNRSLKVDVGAEGQALLRCYKGCTFDNIVRAMGLTPSDTFMPDSARSNGALAFKPAPRPAPKPQPAPAGDPKHSWPVAKTYNYADANGDVVFQVRRREEPNPAKGKKPRKTFVQFRKGIGEWIPGLEGVESRPLYRLPEVLDDLAQDRTLILVEGEKACDALRALGFPGVTHAGGASGWREEYGKQLTGATIVILPDYDDAGRKWAEEAGESLIAHGCTVSMLALPVANEKDDIVEWIDAGGDARQLEKLLARAVPWSVGDPVPLPPGPSKFNLLSVADLEALPPLEWLIGEELAGLFPAGSLLAMFGAPGGGKSFMAADLCCSIASRRDEMAPTWFGNTVRRGPVIYVLAEGGRGFRSRIMAWRAARDCQPDDLAMHFVLEPVNLYGPDDIAHILRAIDRLHIPPSLVVFDTMARSMVGGDDNKSQDVGCVVDRAGRITRETGAGILLVHHARKEDDVERGSGALRGAVDTLALVRTDEDGAHVMSCEKQKDAAPFDPIRFYLNLVGESCVVSAQPPSGPKALTPNQRAALKSLAELFPKGANTTEWLKGTGIPDRSFYRVRAFLVSEGYVSEYEGMRGVSRYAATPSGHWALNGQVL